jgi:RNA polymerase sigma-70 factor (ECF subfamily)
VNRSFEDLFRRHAGALTARLTHYFGPANLDRVEAVVQDAFLTAMERWPKDGLPDDPFAWLLRVARNHAIDQLRRSRRNVELDPDQLEEWPREDDVRFAAEIPDDELRMMFVACHPALPETSQVALTLRTLCGLTDTEIAAALLSETETITKRLVRARRQIREGGISFELPMGEELLGRLQTVLTVLYLLFSEGHRAHLGEAPIRIDLCREAVRLASLLADHPATRRPTVHALLSLMLLQSSRLAARLDGSGELLTLMEQDRSQWDRRLISAGLYHLARSAQGEEMSAYHLEAGIAACHARADAIEGTDWPQIVTLYDRLHRLHRSPVVAVNRAIAIGMANGPEAGLRALGSIANDRQLSRYAPLPAALGYFHAAAGRPEEARAHYDRALQLAGTSSERRFLERCIGRLGRLD